jgi:REP element-mobilizing transposase RayT
MGRAARVAFPGAKYHTMARGNWRADIFSTPADCSRFLMQLRDAAASESVVIFAYALMTNHYHLFFETPLGNVSRFMQRLNTAYSLYFRNRTQKPGHCFQGRYACQLVSGNDYCLRLTRYIHLNPVKTRRFEKASAAAQWAALQRYEWSSFPGYIRQDKASDWIDYRWLDLFAPPASEPGPVSGLEKSGEAQRNRSFQRPDTSSPVPSGPVSGHGKLASDFSGPDTLQTSAPDAKRQAYARFLYEFLECSDDLIREDNETGRLLDNSPIGQPSPKMSGPASGSGAGPVSGLEKSGEAQRNRSFQRPDTSSPVPSDPVSGHGKLASDFSGPDTTPPAPGLEKPSAGVSGLEKPSAGVSGLEKPSAGFLWPDTSGPDTSRPDTSRPDTLAATPLPPVPFDMVTRAVARAFGLRESDLFAHGLHAALAKASAIELACRFTGMNQCEVATRFGYRSETSVGKQRKRLAEQLQDKNHAARFATAQNHVLLAARKRLEQNQNGDPLT